MTNIFISHSQKDVAIINVFLNAFKDTKVNPVLMEYEKFTNPPWNEIQNKIQTSSALFVLLGPNLKLSDYTKHWVIYEVGVADTLRKPIWIFEDVNNEMFFPIPHVNNYLLYNPAQPESLAYLQTVIRSYAVNLAGALGGLLVGAALSTNPLAAIAGLVIGSRIDIPSKPVGIKLRCPYQDCKVTFEFYNNNTTLKCPSCRRTMNWTPRIN